jgi:Flp pilus assembly protein TadG
MIYLQNNRGVAAVELAICLPILILLVFGSIEFGLLFYNQQVITNASREGARAGITGENTDDEIKNMVLTYCNGELINLNGANELETGAVTVSAPDAQNDRTVSVTYNYDFLFAGILGFTDKTLSAQTIMRME